MIYIAVSCVLIGCFICGCSQKNKSKTEETIEKKSIEISMDNWEKYFEIVYEIEPVLDASGSLESAKGTIKISLKEEYKIDTKAVSSVKLQYKSSLVEHNYYIDENTKEIVLKEALQGTEKALGNSEAILNSDTNGEMSFWCDYIPFINAESKNISVWENVEIVDVEGKLLME